MARKARTKARQQAAESEAANNTRLWDRRWFPVALFLLLSLVYFGEFVVSDKVIVAHDAGTDYHRGEESLGEKLRQLTPPVWRSLMGGYPRSEEIRHHYFPTHVISLFTTHHRHLGWRLVLTMFLAGWAMYAYLGELGLRRGAAIWAGVAYMSAPTFLSFPLAGHYAKMSVIALFPLMCLLLERGMNRGRAISFVGLAVLIALGIYSPHTQMLYYALWGLGFYFLHKMVELYRAGPDPRRLAGRTGLFVLAVVLGLGLGAEGVLPPYLYTKTESKRAAGEEGGAGKTADERLAFARSWSLHPEEVASLVVPEFGGFYTPSTGSRYWGRNSMKINSEYFGVLVLLLALLVVPEMRQRPEALFMGLLFLFALAYALGPYTPVHWLFYHLVPGVKVLRTPGMIAFLFAFPACVLAGVGLDRVLGAEGEDRSLLARRLLISGGALTGLALLLALAPRGVTGAWIAALYRDPAPHKLQALAEGYGWLSRGALAVALAAGCGTALLYLRARGRLAAGLLVTGLCGLTLADTWRIDRLFLEYEDPARHQDVRTENPRTLAFLRRGDELFRILPLPSFSLLKTRGYHLYEVDSVTGFHDFTPRRYDRLLDEVEPVTRLLEAKYYEGKQIPYTDEQMLEATRPLLNLLNARYLVTPRQMQLAGAGFPEVFAQENLRVYENASALPWFYLAPSCRVVPDEESAIAGLRDPDLDPGRTVVLERAPPGELAAPDAADVSGDRVERLAYDLDAGYIRLKTTSSGPRMLVVSENYHPNWRVAVDGQPAEIYRANYVWRAVFVPAGEHMVEWRYHSWAVGLSRWAMLASALVMAAVAGRELRKRRAAALPE